MLDAFLHRLLSFHPVSEGLEGALRNLEIVEVPKNTLLLREGQREDFAWVVVKGLIRSYYIKDGEEICSRFNQEEQVVLSVASFYNRAAGYEFVESWKILSWRGSTMMPCSNCTGCTRSSIFM